MWSLLNFKTFLSTFYIHKLPMFYTMVCRVCVCVCFIYVGVTKPLFVATDGDILNCIWYFCRSVLTLPSHSCMGFPLVQCLCGFATASNTKAEVVTEWKVCMRVFRALFTNLWSLNHVLGNKRSSSRVENLHMADISSKPFCTTVEWI